MLGPVHIKRWLRDQSGQPVSRRTFLRTTSLAGAGFLIGCSNEPAPAAQTRPAPGVKPPAPGETEWSDFNPFVRIGSDNRVTVIVKHLDKGQGVTTGLPTIVADELGADWGQVGFEFAPTDPDRYNNLAFGPMQGTGGSTSIANSWRQLRMAAAGAREMLLQAAAQEWDAAPGQLVVKAGRIIHPSSGTDASFGDLAAAAAKLTPPNEPVLKDPSEFTLIGQHVPRLDSNAKTDGSARFTIDVQRPGMLYAAIAHPPRFGGTVQSLQDSAARAVAGVTDVVTLPRGVAVVADSYWTALRGRDALEIEWDFAAAENRGSEQMRSDYYAALAHPAAVARDDGDVDAALGSATRTSLAEYELPFLAHATMEPMDCVVEFDGEHCEIWTASQIPTIDQNVAAQVAGVPLRNVTIHTQFAGGSFGRRAAPDGDFVAEAVGIAKGINGRAPIKLIWSRENDMRAGRYRPMSVHRLSGGLDEQGNIDTWRHDLAIQSFMKGTPFEGMIQDGVDAAAVEGARGLPYRIPNLRVNQHLVDNGVPTLWWRSVGHTHNALVTEAFFDELLEGTGKDPVAERLRLLADHPRLHAVLKLAADKAGWGSILPAGRGRGVAVHESFGSYVAEVAEVTVTEQGDLTVDRVVCAVDCGIAINPDVIRAQMEGGIGYGLSAALREEITLENGEVRQANFDRYRSLRINEMPDVDVHIVASAESPTGVGEPGLPPLAPALLNAIYAAAGKRIRKLPLGNQLKT